jgi:hypothetical protein
MHIGHALFLAVPVLVVQTAQPAPIRIYITLIHLEEAE